MSSTAEQQLLATLQHVWRQRAEEAGLRGGGRVLHHPADSCSGACPIHAPSEHHMVGWPLHWRRDTGVMERRCPHGVGHPDPDHAAFVMRLGGRDHPANDGIHGCDGCCAPPEPAG